MLNNLLIKGFNPNVYRVAKYSIFLFAILFSFG